MLSPYYSDKGFILYHGDYSNILKNFQDNTFDMVFADPPYFLSNGSFTCQNGKMVSVKKADWDMGNGVEDNFTFHLNWLKECRRVLKPTGTLWVSGTYHSIYQCGYAIQKLNMHILNDISWLKPNASPNLSCRFFTASHETLIWARKSKNSKHTFNYSIMKNADWGDDFIKKQNKQMRSVWAIGTPKSNEKRFGKHPTQKPTELMKRIVAASTNKDDVILDPFCGSSTTGIVAHRLKRKFVGIDIEAKYLELSIKRYNSIKK